MSISSVIVTYNPNIALLSNLISENVNSFKEVKVVDNASDNISEIKSITSSFDNVELIPLSENVGIATAQNIAIQHLSHLNDDELVSFFDQDSTLDNDYLTRLELEFSELEATKDKGLILGPVFYHRHFKFEYPIVRFNRHGVRKKLFASQSEEPTDASCIISSGMCVRKKTLDIVGLMDDELFIDYVDTEWCMRAKNKGISILVSPKLEMEHEIGMDNIQVLKWRVPVHSAKRRYYRIRNSFYLGRYTYIPRLVVFREITFSIVHQLLLSIMSKEKCEHLKSLFRGIKDGLAHKRDCQL
ncbi:glycosyltransferase family 2 protein [Enterovibrio baiacu]|uniref:glycosyltransferase family 2 protein n=1 Tax=Enterovibrio baiacu TaxID=2491023 RepID=UPI001010A918|nr:glycosyltransferase family 2 protein [Enterovibrio baiacu]MBE1274801.1 glycosyltransferase family 2 protein [Enterovibrio baiacu]